MGNICTVDMRLRTPKTNVKGLTQALHYLLYSGGMMPNAENLRDYVQVLKQIQGDCRVYLQQLRCIHTNWISFGQMEVVAEEMERSRREAWIAEASQSLTPDGILALASSIPFQELDEYGWMPQPEHKSAFARAWPEVNLRLVASA